MKELDLKSIPNSFNPSFKHPFYFIRKGILEAIVENRLKLNGKLLDFGCGSKPYITLFKNVDEYIGLDYNGEGHDHSNEIIDVFYDGKNIPFPDNYFDSILCSEVFEHLFDINNSLIELKRVLKPNGLMLITCPFVWNEHEVPIDYARYTQYALKDIFEKNNFKIIESYKKGTFVETITQIKNLYMMGAFFGTYTLKRYEPKPFFYRFQKYFIILNNILGIIFNKIFPKRYDLYLTNVFLVENIK